MKATERRSAIAAYKERKREAGIYAVRCVASAHVWIGAAPDLATIQNRLWFTLRNNSNPFKSLQEIWRKHGQDAFSFDVIERLEGDDDAAYIQNKALKNRHAHWVKKLDGIPI